MIELLMEGLIKLMGEVVALADTPIVIDSEKPLRFFGVNLFNSERFTELFIRFIFNSAVIVFIIRYIYYPIAKSKDYLFTYILIAVIVFLLCFSLENVRIELGFALGLFAIFGIIRYRTNPIPIKEMTYLFVVIGISVFNALAYKKDSYAELIFVNSAIIFIIWGLERKWLRKQETSKLIIYEKIDLIKPQRHNELKADLEERTGLIISRIEIGRIDFLTDTARVKIYYFEDGDSTNLKDDQYQ